ncbi:MAG: RNA 3'-phosphate cyclase [Candidatus Altiarchaeales archaeon ex4484_2]|nr:MAG: RNA 3'-phosphate cyclase [Candidatus Altiarchaeales archaeon ex4484_2]
MLSIDGSVGEGGGQIMRSAVALSAVTGRELRVYHIRAGRNNPGLRPQHLAAIKAVASLCDASVEGLGVGSSEIFFSPGEIRSGLFNVDVGTAGSLSLVLQALLVPAFHALGKIEFRLKGGTDVRWSPPVDYLRSVFFPLLTRFGFKVSLTLERRGFYPKGGGRVSVTVHPSKPERIVLVDRGFVECVKGLSYAHRALRDKNVAERQLKSSRRILSNYLSNPKDIKLEEEYVDSPSLGSGLLLYAICNNSILGFDSLGGKGKRSETVGIDAANGLIRELESGAALDRFMADQIIPYLALAGGEVSVSMVSGHCRTNVEVVNRFGFDLRIKDNKIISRAGVR